ncbi:EboA domain-containing protein [Robertkochia aurantiaca]|uniref:EboA domain-containing protein n=1 Tax=Robertkochia aurantiaca TaxID=2873700 RepID=UPI001CCE7801|nr:EboA domain-containing protein [Robertkochia sp. 3YJGBD-33]
MNKTLPNTMTADDLHILLERNLENEVLEWLEEQINRVLQSGSARLFYMTYTLIPSQTGNEAVKFDADSDIRFDYLQKNTIRKDQLARLYLMNKILTKDAERFREKIAKLIELADTGELQTFLRYLALLPEAEMFLTAAVEALRTNIAVIFDAISQENPYPAAFFNDQQWNQMYLKAAFMQRPLDGISGVEQRANAELARIISDYAHERWAADRDIDPSIWRPVTGYITGKLQDDMRRLSESENIAERRAAALCCYSDDNDQLRTLAIPFKEEIENGKLNWNNLKE